MLSLFPQILFLAPVAATLIRIALAVMAVYEGWQLLRRPDTVSRVSGVSAFVVAAIFVAGAWTQLFGLLAALSFVASIFMPQFRTLPRSTYLLAIVLALTLVVTGAGAFAFDLPL